MVTLPQLVQLAPSGFHQSWSLWWQLPLVVGVIALAAAPLGSALRSMAWSRSALVLVVTAPLVVGWLLPQGEYHFAGHEGAYGELLDGGLPESGDLDGHRTFAVPAGLAWAMGRVAPGSPARTTWLLGNRGALALVLLFLGAAAATLAGDEPSRQRRASLWAVAGGLTVVPLLGWSATAFFVVPALALGRAALLLGLRDHPAPALAVGALALGSRMETAPLLLAAGLAVGAVRWKEAFSGRRAAVLAVGLGVFAVQAFTLSQKRSELPLEDVRPDPSVLLENLANVQLGGVWCSAWVLLLVVIALLRRVRSGRGRRPAIAIGVGLVVATVQPIGLVDVGARHLLPIAALAVIGAAASLARLPGSSSTKMGGAGAMVVVVGFPLAVLAFTATPAVELRTRYAAGLEAFPASWEAEASATGRTGPAAELLDLSCYVVAPEGRAVWPAARDSTDVREIHRAALARGAGWCVQWVVGDDAEFVGDTRAERLDRAIRTLDLVPVGWIDSPTFGDRPWLLFEPR